MKKILFGLLLATILVAGCETFQLSSVTTGFNIKGEKVALTMTKTDAGIIASVAIRGYIFECGKIDGADINMDSEVIIDEFEITKSIKFKIAGKEIECRMKE